MHHPEVGRGSLSSAVFIALPRDKAESYLHHPRDISGCHFSAVFVALPKDDSGSRLHHLGIGRGPAIVRYCLLAMHCTISDHDGNV